MWKNTIKFSKKVCHTKHKVKSAISMTLSAFLTLV